MSAPLALSVVVPLYNEVDNVVPLIEEVTRELCEQRYELILVDDGSTDGTAAVLKQQDGPAVRVIALPKNRGQSAALYTGMMAAEAPVIAVLDGDLQLYAADILVLFKRLVPEIDLVCGYRQERQDTWSKRWQSKVANSLRRLVLRDGVRDAGCSLKVMRRECREALVFFDGMHRFLPAMIQRAGHGISECPVKHRARVHGKSKYGIHNRAWRGLLDLAGVWWFLVRRGRARMRTRGKGT